MIDNLNIETKIDSPAKVLALNGIPTNQYIANAEFNAVAEKTNEVVDGLNTVEQAVADISSGEAGKVYPTLAAAIALNPKPGNGIVFQVSQNTDAANAGYYSFQSTAPNGVKFEKSFANKASTFDVLNNTNYITGQQTGAYIKSEGKKKVSVAIGKNLFNKNDSEVVIGSFINSAGGLSVNAAYYTSAYITVTVGSKYTKSHNFASTVYSAFYDANFTLVAGSASNAQVITAPAGAMYVRISVNMTNLAAYQLEIGEAATTFADYTVLNGAVGAQDIKASAITSEKLAAAAVTNQSIADATISAGKLGFAQLMAGGNNLFNVNAADVSLNCYLNSTGGLVAASTTYHTTGFIPVSIAINANISVSRSRFSAFYDASKNFIAGTYNSTSSTNATIAIPAGAAYYRVSCPYTLNNGVYYWDVMMVNYGSIMLPYETYKAPSYKLTGVSILDENADSVNVFLPEEICIAVGRTIEIYNSQVMWSGHAKDFHFLWSGVGACMKRKWMLTGTTGAIGSYVLNLKVYDKNNRLAYNGNTTVKVVAAAITTPMVVCPIGDSLTNGKAWQPELINLGAGNISFTGTRGPVQSGVARTHEGRSGATSSYYLGNNSYTFDASGQTGLDGRAQNLNPFWNPSTSDVDFNYYKTNYAKNPTHLLIWLGTNGITVDPTANATAIKTFVDKIRATGGATIPVFIVHTLFRGNQDGIGVQTGSDGYVANSAYKLSEDLKVYNLQVKVKELFAGLAYTHLIPVSTCHDSEYNFTPAPELAAAKAVNPRAWQTEYMPSEATHPQQAGYLQIADIIYSHMAANQ